jgi:drug/metabolite transporter (DMT)-like permease
MDAFVFAAVLFAAACHAGWNAAVKKGIDPLATTVAISIGAALIALPLMPFAGLPAAEAWLWVLASVLVHLFYFAGLIESYRVGDMSQVYPIARGSAPLLTAAGSALLIDERIAPMAWAGVLLLASGVVLMSLRGGRDLARLDRRAVGFALVTAVTICAYSLVDGIGARLSGNALAYSLALFIGIGPVMLAYALFRGGAGVVVTLRPLGAIGLAGGALQLGSYGIAIWAMTVAPIAVVAALRETSVLFGALIAVLVLREPPSAVRVAAACAIVIGLVLIRVS